MFLFPTCGAIVADSVIIYLHTKYHNLLEVSNTEVTFCVENTSYLEPLSILRLVFLLPLIYHTYSGTRLNFSLVYSLVHVASALLILMHVLALTILNNSGSLTDDWPPTIRSSSASFIGDGETIIVPEQLDHVDDFGKRSPKILLSNTEIMGNDLFIFWYKITRILLALSMFSITLHVAILLHLRSSAPSSGAFRKKVQGQQGVGRDIRKRKLLAYWVYDKYRRQPIDGKVADGGRIIEPSNDSDQRITSPLRNGNIVESTSPLFKSQVSDVSYESALYYEQDSDVSEETEPFLLLDNERQNSFEHPRSLESAQDTDTAPQRKRENTGLGAGRYHNRGGVSFRNLAGIQACFNDGYDEFLSEIKTRFQEAKGEWGARLDEVTDRVQKQTGSGNFLLQLNQQTPFQALLHLYAHEEVLTNNKLDRAFSNNEDNLALSFYAPQLLVFLLHNAYLNTGRLEIWLLEKCRTNIQFAHRCFWFLRAWCLQGGVNELENDDALSQSSHQVRSDIISRKKRSSSGGSISAMIENWGSKEYGTDADRSIGDAKTVSSGLILNHSTIKLKPEERQSLEALLSKVMECGEDAAQKLEYGHIDDGGNWEMPQVDSLSAQEDSTSLCPSRKHLDAASAKYTYGFQPLPHPDTRLEPITANANGHENFLRTPDFLDKLIRIADDLMEQPRSRRTVELRRRLKQLEVDFLPSNSIYVPINDSLHRVWRIVSSESIALSTKERVPCIVCLEVVDYSKKKDISHTTNATLSERILVTNWCKLSRPPQRHNTLLSKVSSITKKRLQKLRHDIEDSIRDKDILSSDIDVFDASIDEFRNDSQGNASSLLQDMDLGGHNTTQAKKSLEMNRNDIENQQQTPTRISERQQSMNTISAEKDEVSLDVSSSTQKLGQWLNRSQSGSFDEDSIHDDNKPDGSSIAEVSQPKLLPDLDNNGNVSDFDGSGVTDQVSPNSLYQDYESTMESKPTKQKSKKHKRRSSGISTRSPPVVFKEDWQTKEERLRSKSTYGMHPNWRLLPILIKSNDDLRQEQLAAQLIHCMASILAHADVPVWLYPYEIVALTFRGGIIEAIPDTISIDSLRKNHPNFIDLKAFVEQHFGPAGCDEYENAKANFVESLAAYSIVCFLLQVKDRHNGNILLDNKGHLIHIDFGFFFLSSPGKNSGFESAPFKLTREFVEMMDGAHSHTFVKFRELCYKTFLELRKNCFKITLLVQMLIEGNEDLDCFRNRPHDAVHGLQERFRLDLNDRACLEYVNLLIDESLENWTTTCYDRYQRCCVGVM